ncbi:basic salivary proline-rich protein 3-like [Marmota marmota marmota]|uniref:basic salivary proline-rich protein 3-like n=1 Tax=Marmota marmota marmota TaxID=9994 RepID=UPI0020929DBE|nr:basic salivary proline-rich protein 3-like [Marmota marmota marmota]
MHRAAAGLGPGRPAPCGGCQPDPAEQSVAAVGAGARSVLRGFLGPELGSYDAGRERGRSPRGWSLGSWVPERPGVRWRRLGARPRRRDAEVSAPDREPCPPLASPPGASRAAGRRRRWRWLPRGGDGAGGPPGQACVGSLAEPPPPDGPGNPEVRPALSPGDGAGVPLRPFSPAASPGRIGSLRPLPVPGTPRAPPLAARGGVLSEETPPRPGQPAVAEDRWLKVCSEFLERARSSPYRASDSRAVPAARFEGGAQLEIGAVSCGWCHPDCGREGERWPSCQRDQQSEDGSTGPLKRSKRKVRLSPGASAPLTSCVRR